MITHKTKWLLVGLVCLALWQAHASAQGGQWNTLNAAGVKAYQQGNYPEAEKQLGATLKEAEGFGPRDPRLATSLFGLASVYHTQGRYAEAEPLYKRAGDRREGPGAGPSPRGPKPGELCRPVTEDRTKHRGDKDVGPRRVDPGQARRAEPGELANVRLWL